MKISNTRGPGAGTRIGASRPAAAPTRSAAVNAAPKAGDATSILGIPESEFTPKVRDAIMHLLHEVENLRSELEQTRARMSELEKLADQDALLPIANRRAFVRELSRMLAFAQRYGGEVSVLYFDVNDMKQINDTHGHAAGDAALAHIATYLAQNVRESDMVGRLGGDEFGVILAKASENEAAQKAQSLADGLEQSPLAWKGHVIPVHASFGAYALKGAEDAAAMLHQADQAMYSDKRGADSRVNRNR